MMNAQQKNWAVAPSQPPQLVIPIHKMEKSLEMGEETSSSTSTSSSKQWRKSNLFLEIPSRSLQVSRQEFVQIKMPTPTPTPTPTPKRVNFLLTPTPSDSRPYGSPGPSSTRGRSSIRNLLPKLAFKQRGSTSDADRPANTTNSVISSTSTSTTEDHKPSMPTSWSFTKIFTPRAKRACSLPVTPIGYSNPDSSHGRNINCPSAPAPHVKGVRCMSRSLSVPVINKEKASRKTDSFFRVISTPRVKDGDARVSNSTTVDHENNEDSSGEDIAEEEAVCRICFVELCEGGETLKMECSCKGELALAHQECAVKWFALKGNKTCEVCKQEVKNLPVTLLRIQSCINRNAQGPTTFSDMEINGYRVWHEIPILVIVSMLAYFCFLEQLLVGKMGSSAIAISLPFSCVLGLLASMTSSTMVKRRFVWVYASIQFALVVLFAHIFYNLVHVQAVVAVLLSTFAGFGVAMSISSITVEVMRWKRRREAVRRQINISNDMMLSPTHRPPPPFYSSPRQYGGEVETFSRN